MQKRISKKILSYLFILLFLGTPYNKEFSEIYLNKNHNFEIFSLSDFDDTEVINDLLNYKYQNLLLLKKENIIETLNKNKMIENYYFYKNYPSKLVVKLKKTQFLAVTKKNGINFYIGSNGNLIKVKDNLNSLPIIFGNVDVDEFLKLKNLIDDSIFDYNDVKNLYYFKSKRWDIETKEGLLFKLPQDNLIKSFKLLMNILDKKDLQNINVIDLRQNNQIILNG